MSIERPRRESAAGTVPKVSIVTPTYNSIAYLPETIASVRAQTWPSIEHVVIDDGSDDGGQTRELLGSTPGLVWRSRPNRGQYATVNEALGMVTGDIVTIISADDRYHSPTSVAEAVEALAAAGPGIDGIYGKTLYVDPSGAPFTCQPPHRQPAWMTPYRFPIAHCSLFLWKHALDRHGARWDESLRYVGDAEWILSLVKSGAVIRRVDNCLSDYRVHPAQTSAGVENPRRIAEHAAFDRRHGVVPWIDWLVVRLLAARRRALHFRQRALGKQVVG